MGFLKDAISVFKKKDLIFLESFQETKDVYTFLFEKEKDLTWEAGQHGLFTIIHKKIKNNTRPITIASAPSENVIQITTKIGSNRSDFKDALLELKQGMKIRMAGPVGNLSLKDNNPALFIAGGMGITPYRSILKQLEAEGNNGASLNLLYLDSEKTYLFKDELEKIAKNSLVRISYVDSRGALHEEMNKFINVNKDNANYFIAGPKTMVDTLAQDLKNKNIKKQNIKKDAFYGY